MLSAFIGFLYGLVIPYMARRFSKFMPATPGYALFRLVWPVKSVSRQKKAGNRKYLRLKNKYLMRSVGWAIVCSALSYAAYICFWAVQLPWILSLIFILLLLYEIDERMFLLPDILTVPLLILGFLSSNFMVLGEPVFLTPMLASALGAAVGYVLPVLGSLFLVKKYPEAFGGGDIKLLAAVGSWVGLFNVPKVILASCVIFAFFLIIKKARSAAFGPAIVIATLGLVFFLI